MEARSSSFASSGSSQSRLLSREIPSGSRLPLRGVAAHSRRRSQFHVNRVASTGELETDDEDEGESTVVRSTSERESRKKLEVVTGLLREGYGVGAILTAAAFRGAALTTDLLKGMTQSTTAAARRRRVTVSKKERTTEEEPSFAEKLQQVVSESLMASAIVWRRKGEELMKADILSGENADPLDDALPSLAENQTLSFLEEGTEVVEETDTREEEIVSLADPWVEGYAPENEEHEKRELKDLLGIPTEDEMTSSHISEERLRPSAFVDATEEGRFAEGLAETLQLPTDVDLETEMEMQTPTEFTETPVKGPEEINDMPEEEATFESPEVTDEDMEDTSNASIEERESLNLIEKLEQTVEDVTKLPETGLDEFPGLPVEDVNVLADLVDEESTEEQEDDKAPEWTPSPQEEQTPVAERERLSTPILQEASEPASPDVTLENNVETFVKQETHEETVEESEDDSTLVMHRAKEILDEIANFEIETGESVDSQDEEDDVPAVEQFPQPSQKSRAEQEQELREQMRLEAERRLRAMKIGNASRMHKESAVKVERPTTSPQDLSAYSSRRISDNTKGLDYIKSYAKESQEYVRNENDPRESLKESTGSYFTPPSILQDQKKQQTIHAASGTSRDYAQWNEIDRLRRVREIGTVLWLGRGGNGGKGGNGNGGSGGRGGNGGSSSEENSEDKSWWIQVCVSMMTMTALVFALLMTVSNRLGKQKEGPKTKAEGSAK